MRKNYSVIFFHGLLIMSSKHLTARGLYPLQTGLKFLIRNINVLTLVTIVALAIDNQ